MVMESSAIRLPIGVSDFKKISATAHTPQAYTFIDKTLFIRDFIADGAEVVLWTRPRRFGKTLNLSMLYYYFSCTEQQEQDLFAGLKIKSVGEQYQAYQGQYPVIFVSFKDIKEKSFQKAKEGIIKLLCGLFESHQYLLDGDTLSEQARIIYQQFLAKQPPEDELKGALKLLSKYLYDYHQQKIMILMDEYDAPIYAADANDYYPEMIDLIRGLLSSALKDNTYLHKAGVTGILRLAKEDIFSGLNNLVVDSFVDGRYAPYFGFSQEEVSSLCELAKIPVDLSEMQTWYNGYQVRDLTLYNPWSIINCLAQGGKFEPYWTNTSDNHLIRKLLLSAGPQIKSDFERLMQGKSVEGMLDNFLNLKYLENNHTSIFTLLCMSGYLNAVESYRFDGEVMYAFRIPNQEIMLIYRRIVTQWLSSEQGAYWLKTCMEDLKAMRMAAFGAKLQQIALNVFSYHDMKGRLPESFFHGFMLGLIVYCQGDYTISSNREAGTGRFDIAMIPKNTDSNLPGILFEIKSLVDADMPALEAAAKEALAQVDDKHYTAVFSAHPGIKQLPIGIAFSGKLLALAHDQSNAV